MEMCTPERIEEIKKLLLDIYEKYSLEKITKIDRLLGKYKGREEEFLEFVHHKYKLGTDVSTAQAQIGSSTAAIDCGHVYIPKDSGSGSSSSPESIPIGGSGPSSIEFDCTQRSLVTCGTLIGVSEIVPISTSKLQIREHSTLHNDNFIDSLEGFRLEVDLGRNFNSIDIDSNAEELIERKINGNHDVERFLPSEGIFKVETKIITPSTNDSIRSSKDSSEESCIITYLESGSEISLLPTAPQTSSMILIGKFLELRGITII